MGYASHVAVKALDTTNNIANRFVLLPTPSCSSEVVPIAEMLYTGRLVCIMAS